MHLHLKVECLIDYIVSSIQRKHFFSKNDLSFLHFFGAQPDATNKTEVCTTLQNQISEEMKIFFFEVAACVAPYVMFSALSVKGHEESLTMAPNICWKVCMIQFILAFMTHCSCYSAATWQPILLSFSHDPFPLQVGSSSLMSILDISEEVSINSSKKHN